MVATQSRSIDWKAGILAGIIAGAVFIVLEMIMVPLFLGMPAWAPIRMIAAIALGPGVLPPPATFDAGIALTAFILHFALSIIFALILAAIISRVATAPAIIGGLVFGLLLYFVNFHILTVAFPWFAEARNWVSIFAHLVFGGVAAWTYKAFQRPTAQRIAPEQQPGRRPPTGPDQERPAAD
jgi:uncharacterized membrane protein YagU involved in acid resistance